MTQIKASAQTIVKALQSGASKGWSLSDLMVHVPSLRERTEGLKDCYDHGLADTDANYHIVLTSKGRAYR